LFLVLLAAPAFSHPRHSHAQNLPSSEQVVPPGFGTLKQEDLQIALATSAIEIRFTPLDPRVINLLAPDAYQAMAVLVKNNRGRIDSAARYNAVSRPGLAYVQFYGLAPGANFDAQSLVLVFRGRLLRPISILPYSPNFNDGRLEPRQQVTAFYLFDEQIPVLEPFSLQYYQQYNTEWTSNRVSKINTERQLALLRSSKGQTTTAPAGTTTAPTR
jgi:hypothetical protein